MIILGVDTRPGVHQMGRSGLAFLERKKKTTKNLNSEQQNSTGENDASDGESDLAF